MSTSFDTPLSAEEFEELGELLASLPEDASPMEADYMDGFLTALSCLPESVAVRDWMPLVFDRDGSEEAVLEDPQEQRRLEDLVYRRHRMIEQTLRARRPIDPIVYELEDERGRPLRGWEAIGALAPFAEGFWDAMNRWSGLNESEDELVSSALLGILRHLPEELIGDLAEVRDDLDLESPLENLNQAIEDLAVSVAEIASVTRGFTEEETPERRPRRLVRGPTPRGGRRR